MIKRFLFLSCLVVLFASGCIGGKSVEPSYLRIGNQGAGLSCEKVKADVPKLAVKRFSALPALDRETVVIARGPVLKPDYRWSWEGTPAEIFNLEVGYALSCLNSYEVVSPYRPGIERDVILSGVITSFELQQSGDYEFQVAVRYSLWDGTGNSLLARKEVSAAVPVKSMDGHAIAMAAQKAVAKVMDITIKWLDGLGGLPLNQSNQR